MNKGEKKDTQWNRFSCLNTGSVMPRAIQILEVVFLRNVDPSSEIDDAV